MKPSLAIAMRLPDCSAIAASRRSRIDVRSPFTVIGAIFRSGSMASVDTQLGLSGQGMSRGAAARMRSPLQLSNSRAALGVAHRQPISIVAIVRPGWRFIARTASAACP